MTPPPPRSDAGDGIGVDRESQILDRIAELQGVVNVANGELVSLVAEAIEAGWAGGDGILTADAWVAVRAGITPGQAAGIVRVARRTNELPHTVAALNAGVLTVDQVAEIARHVPTEYEESAAEVAAHCTVRQLRQALPHYADPKPDGSPRQRRDLATGHDEHGWWIRGRLPESEGALVDQALKALREDHDRQTRADTPSDEKPHRATLADALIAMAEAALDAGEAARPGTDRYLIHVHLHQGRSGPELMTHLGITIPDSQRRLIGCNARLRATLHHGTTPVAQGRTTRIIGRRLRRLIEHRDHGCAIPGCNRTHRLQIHHIWHWEDGGPTETWNLLTLCDYHHARHHEGAVGIVGNADLPRHQGNGVIFTDTHGRQLDPVGTPTPPAAGLSATDAARTAGLPEPKFVPPTGERLDRRQFHLQRNPPEPPVHPVTTRPAADAHPDPAPAPSNPPRRRQHEQWTTDSAWSFYDAAPTRAGPAA